MIQDIYSRSKSLSSGLVLGVVLFPLLASAGFLWFETMPELSDPCTMIMYDLDKNSFTDFHPSPTCTSGGLAWFGTWGRIHLHFSLDNSTDTNFRVCLTGGFAN